MATFQEKSNETNGGAGIIPPTTTVLTAASKLSIVEDKPIMLDNWIDSFNKETLVPISIRDFFS